MATTRTSTKAPTKREIEEHTRDDLREVYMLAFDQFAITPSDINIYTTDRINTRYARELLGVLVHEGLLVVSDVNGEEDVWQVAQPGTHDEVSEEEASTFIDKWLAERIPTANPAASTPTATSPQKSTPKAVKNPTGKCRCGCDENVAKSNYRPGHDARHAGQVARAIAENGGDWVLLDALPSEALRQKARDMAGRLLAKAAAKTKTDTPPIVKAKVGRATYEGIVEDGVFHYVDSKNNEKQSTKFALV
jgi:hypothetical protein